MTPQVPDTTKPLIRANGDGIITYINETFTQAFGWTSEEIVGKSLTAIIPLSFRDAHHLGFSRFLTTGIPTLLNQPLILKILTRDGRELDTEHYITAQSENGQWNFAATIAPL
ncbi:MAG: PAS domain-containing protein [Candidatus Sumerlaeaceae bacterium]